MIVEISEIKEHCGNPAYLKKYEISDNCPKCGKPRGKIFKGLSYDGSRRLSVDCWNNPCGHIDMYEDIRKDGVVVKND